MTNTIIVAGHACLDILPTIKPLEGGIDSLLVPGKLVEVGSARVTTGGAVSNTGLALSRLGFPVLLAAKVGDDAFGRSIRENYDEIAPGLSEGVIVDPAAETSYSIVISPPGIDRMFWHCPGANHTFVADDISDELLAKGQLIHFGYPPLMKEIYRDDGAELVKLFRRAKEAGLTTSLDMTLPDPDSESGQIDWRKLLRNVLPYVDIFVPSLDEIAYMLDPVAGMQVRELTASGVPLGGCDAAEVERICTTLLEMGSAVILIKMGQQGAYAQTSDVARLRSCGAAGPRNPQDWAGKSLQAACFTVEVAGTTGAGDSTIAGFIGAIASGASPAEALRMAVAVGSVAVEGLDGARGLPHWDVVSQRLARGWGRDPSPVAFPETV